ncbi:response regulator transcription factor [Arthrobacter sp. Sa2CUA1]|uniref:Response regulator transcription factor n=1 Tax=Arthrobacter gallicola TaxID=2762225 RepID=A0ABR8UUH6_9MICC|nr:response regulator transcription factor [Arthrobacter gallicola]MBD7996207.1 response regulator transcription factor [Arthrobacter gallicola]
MISVVLVDDQDLVRAGLRTLLSSGEDILVTGEAADGRRGVEAAARHRPDVVLMDIRMPVMDGIEATRLIRSDKSLAATRVLILTTFDDDRDVLEAIRAGAAGYLMKDAPGPELRDAVRRAADGEKLLSPAVVGRLLEIVAAGPRPPVPDPRLSLLSDRELDVLVRVGHGDTNQEIAAVLFISPATSRTYVSRILGKLGARDRTELAVIAHRSGLVQ